MCCTVFVFGEMTIQWSTGGLFHPAHIYSSGRPGRHCGRDEFSLASLWHHHHPASLSPFPSLHLCLVGAFIRVDSVDSLRLIGCLTQCLELLGREVGETAVSQPALCSGGCLLPGDQPLWQLSKATLIWQDLGDLSGRTKNPLTKAYWEDWDALELGVLLTRNYPLGGAFSVRKAVEANVQPTIPLWLCNTYGKI